MLFFSRVAVLLTLLVSGAVAAPSEIDGFLLSKNYGPRANEVRDSPLERVQVKQETGFDGKVRSIRFSSELEDDRRNQGIKQRLASPNNFNFQPIQAAYNQDMELPMPRMIQIEEASREQPFFESIAPTAIKAPRSKRETDKHLQDNQLDDLDTAEAKVFRPLFVYRQQVSRRIGLQNNKQSINNRRRIRLRTRPSFSRYYYPYQYSPAYTYFY